MNSLHKIHFHVHYEEVYQYKRFEKFSIKTLTRIGCPTFKNEQKIGQSNLGVKEDSLKGIGQGWNIGGGGIVNNYASK